MKCSSTSQTSGNQPVSWKGQGHSNLKKTGGLNLGEQSGSGACCIWPVKETILQQLSTTAFDFSKSDKEQFLG